MTPKKLDLEGKTWTLGVEGVKDWQNLADIIYVPIPIK